jgi:methionyl-tRNA formyltransferase
LYNSNSMARVVFMGSPDFAVPTLQVLHQAHNLAGVVTQPDRPAGRGRRLVEPPVKRLAVELNLPVIQPERLRQPEAMAALRQWAPDVIVVAAFGQILRQEALTLAPHGCVNVHASLLPRHRGAAPVAAAILAGDSETGVTIMKMEIGLDTGPVLSQRAEAIRPDDTTGSLTERLAQVGADLLAATLPAYLAGQLSPLPQDDASATYARQLRKEDGLLDWTLPASDLERRVRAFQPWPGAYTYWQGQPLKVVRAHADPGGMAPAGHVVEASGEVGVGAGAGLLVLDEVQPGGRKAMRTIDFARGARGFVGARLPGGMESKSA